MRHDQASEHPISRKRRLAKPLIAAAAAALATAGIAAASSLGISSTVSEGPASNVGGCPEIILYFSRGSGQELDTDAERHHEQLYGGNGAHELGLANPGFQLLDALIDKYGPHNVGAIANGYLAVPVPVNPLRRGAYLASVDQGVGSAERNINDLTRLCPHSKLILGGFSQGAQVTHIALANLNQGEQNHIAAVLLFGDPYFSAEDAVIRSEQNANPGLNPDPSKRGVGYFAFSNVHPPKVDVTFRGKAFSWCHRFDPVCQTVDLRHPWKSLKGVSGHKAYAEEIAAAVGVISSRVRTSGSAHVATSATHRYAIANTCHGGMCAVAEWTGPGQANYDPAGALHEKQVVGIVCQITGETVSGGNGGSSSIWDRLDTGSFVPDYYVGTPGIGVPTPGIPECHGLKTGVP
jgi:hypothetical protein